MKVRLTVILMVLLFCHTAAAQSYAIRIAFNTNLRASNSLEARIVETAPAGSTLSVIGEADRWLRIDHNGRNVWMANWVRYERVGASAPARNLPSNIDNCCFVDRLCNTDSEWTDGYWAFRNGQCAAPVQTQTRPSTQPVTLPSTQVDNCCFVDRQCNNDQDWADGYWAYQNNQCGSAAPAITQPASAAATAADNCCYLGWTCHSNEDWLTGFRAYQNNQCQGASQSQSSSIVPNVDLSQIDNCCRYNRQCSTELDWERGFAAYQYFRCSTAIPMEIQGSSTFVQLYRLAYNLLKEVSPRLYHYGITGFDRIRQVPPGSLTGVLVRERTYVQAPTKHITSFASGTPITEAAVVEAVGGILHEACHVHMGHGGTATKVWRDELPCLQVELEGYRVVDPDDTHGFIAWIQNIIANIRNPAYWWWTQ